MEHQGIGNSQSLNSDSSHHLCSTEETNTQQVPGSGPMVVLPLSRLVCQLCYRSHCQESRERTKSRRSSTRSEAHGFVGTLLALTSWWTRHHHRYSLEDNALWQRHLLGLVFQAISGAYVVIQSLPNTLWVIILLLYIAGTFKYVERTIAMYLASSDKYRGSIPKMSDSDASGEQVPDSDSDETHRQEKEEERMTLLKVSDSDSDDSDESHSTEKDSMPQYGRQQRPIKLERPYRPLTDLEILQFGFWFFNNFKTLMVNTIFSPEQRDESRAFFSRLQPEEALRILEVELSFVYGGLYTKTSVLHTWVGAVIRTIALGSLLSALCIFHYRPKKSHEFHGADIVITYTLFLVGIALDVASLLMAMPSEWTFAVLSRLNEDGTNRGSRIKINHAINWFLGLKKLQWKKQECCEGFEHKVLNTPFLLRRWAGRIKLFNFIAYSVRADIEWIHDAEARRRQGVGKFIMHHFTDTVNILKKQRERMVIWNHEFHRYIREVINNWPMCIVVIVEFWFTIPHFFTFIGDFITNFLDINDLDEIIPKRFVHSEPLTDELWSFIFTQLRHRLERPEKERSQTYSKRKGWATGNAELEEAEAEGLMRYISDVDYDRSLILWHIATELCYREEAFIAENHDIREFSKIISDYMMYLLIKQPNLMSEVAGIGKIRFRDTLAEAEKFFKRRHNEKPWSVEAASYEILSISVDIDPRDVKGNRSKSVLFEAAALVKELKRVRNDHGEAYEWRVVSQVWMELLFHAACNCDATARMEQLSKGGELINFVWLAMAHFGLGDQLSSSENESLDPNWVAY